MAHRLSIHTHPIMERKLGIPDDHVIIDVNLFQAILKICEVRKTVLIPYCKCCGREKTCSEYELVW